MVQTELDLFPQKLKTKGSLSAVIIEAITPFAQHLYRDRCGIKLKYFCWQIIQIITFQIFALS